MTSSLTDVLHWWGEGLAAGLPDRLVRLFAPAEPVRLCRDGDGWALSHPTLGAGPMRIDAAGAAPRRLGRALGRFGARLVWPPADVLRGRFEAPPIGTVDARRVAAANLSVWTPFEAGDVLFAARAERIGERTFIDCALIARADFEAERAALGGLGRHIRAVDLGHGLVVALPRAPTGPERVLAYATRALTATAVLLAVALGVLFWRDTGAELETLRGTVAAARPDIARIAALQADLAAYDRLLQAPDLTPPASALELDLLRFLAGRLPEAAGIRRLSFEREPRWTARVEILGAEPTAFAAEDERFVVTERAAGGAAAQPTLSLTLTRRNGS